MVVFGFAWLVLAYGSKPRSLNGMEGSEQRATWLLLDLFSSASVLAWLAILIIQCTCGVYFVRQPVSHEVPGLITRMKTFFPCPQAAARSLR